ncbi:hypothetical protein EK21DRAFT_107173 [Setomelanomma holmii]|uniref:Uncharacterized protein n=1 Tax=Setomelanomma holmii TaxID=210430 RepID=A0A9P4LRS2_9PLEO|nr:hypothetical protein EK21DRAFT_107173 [Setomelanomma holmii]
MGLIISSILNMRLSLFHLDSGHSQKSDALSWHLRSNSSAITPYEGWNAANDGFCTREDRKPAYSTTINNMQAAKWHEIWELYKAFQANGPNTAVLIEQYNLTKTNTAPTESAAFNQKLRKVAFAHGDETPEAIDGNSLAKLKTLKKKYDPSGAFNQWFKITREDSIARIHRFMYC